MGHVVDYEESRIPVVDITEGASLEPFYVEEQGQNGSPPKKRLHLKGIFQRADHPNENGRIYPREILNREIRKLQPKVQAGQLLAGLDHPDDGRHRIRDAVGVITKLQECDEDGYVYGEIRVSENTENGKILKGHIENGFRPGISSRGRSATNVPCFDVKTWERDGKQYYFVNDAFRLTTFDVVVGQSVQEAIPKTVFEQNEGGSEKMKEKFLEAVRQMGESEILSALRESGKFDALKKAVESEISPDIEKKVKEQLDEERKKIEEEIKQKFDEEVEKKAEEMAAELVEGADTVILNLVKALAETGIIDADTGTVIGWDEVKAVAGGAISELLPRRTSRTLRTINKAGANASESEETTENDILEEMKKLRENLNETVKDTVRQLLEQNEVVRKVEEEQYKEALCRRVEEKVGKDNPLLEAIKQAVLSFYEQGVRFKSDEEADRVIDVQRRIVEAGASQPAINPIYGPKGQSSEEPGVNETKTDVASLLFG